MNSLCRSTSLQSRTQARSSMAPAWPGALSHLVSNSAEKQPGPLLLPLLSTRHDITEPWAGRQSADRPLCFCPAPWPPPVLGWPRGRGWGLGHCVPEGEGNHSGLGPGEGGTSPALEGRGPEGMASDTLWVFVTDPHWGHCRSRVLGGASPHLHSIGGPQPRHSPQPPAGQQKGPGSLATSSSYWLCGDPWGSIFSVVRRGQE